MWSGSFLRKAFTLFCSIFHCTNLWVLSSTALNQMELEIREPLHWPILWMWIRAWRPWSKQLSCPYSNLKCKVVVPVWSVLTRENGTRNYCHFCHTMDAYKICKSVIWLKLTSTIANKELCYIVAISSFLGSLPTAKENLSAYGMGRGEREGGYKWSYHSKKKQKRHGILI